jgi:hypothetical protein
MSSDPNPRPSDKSSVIYHLHENLLARLSTSVPSLVPWLLASRGTLPALRHSYIMLWCEHNQAQAIEVTCTSSPITFQKTQRKPGKTRKYT